jgi:hypothetical protein
MQYLLDTNVFIEAKNRYYAFDICPAFWDWIDAVAGVKIGSIENVKNELINGKDDLASWIAMRAPNGWFLTVQDTATQKAFSSVANFVATAGFNSPGVAQFLSGADPWLIAKAMTTGTTVVTHEVFAPQARKRVPIPNVCKQFNVPFVNTFDAMRTMSCKFA